MRAREEEGAGERAGGEGWLRGGSGNAQHPRTKLLDFRYIPPGLSATYLYRDIVSMCGLHLVIPVVIWVYCVEEDAEEGYEDDEVEW